MLIEVIDSSKTTRWVEMGCISLFIPLFYIMVKEYLERSKRIKIENDYVTHLNTTLIRQSHNSLFYLGDVTNGAKELTREVASSIGADRCSVWLYTEDKSSIVCEQLYIAQEEKWHQGAVLHKKDCESYFKELEINPIIVAKDATLHPATKCFTKSYLIPLGIKSMLDVPIIYRGETIGVICIESYTSRAWMECESNFAQNLSSLYSFAYSVAESNAITQDMIELNRFLEAAAIISKTDANGKIIYVNHRFEEVSGWKLDEVIGKDHHIVNSGEHPKSFWKKMYETALAGGIWNAICTNRRKDGELYYVDTYIKADFDPETRELRGFISIRQDVTDLINSTKEIEKKNSYLEHAAKILRHDMHSGINTYMPRGLSSLERRLTEEQMRNLKIDAPVKMIKEGLRHTQKVYKGVYEFTNLVKKDAVLDRTECNVKSILTDYLSATAYQPQVILDDNLPTINVNEALFCTAVDNLIRNGLKYNDSDNKIVKVYFEKSRPRLQLSKKYIVVEDNGRGMTQEDFERLSRPYVRKEGQKESGSGLGLNICKAILEEHGYRITAERLKQGTKLKIQID